MGFSEQFGHIGNVVGLSEQFGHIGNVVGQARCHLVYLCVIGVASNIMTSIRVEGDYPAQKSPFQTYSTPGAVVIAPATACDSACLT